MPTMIALAPATAANIPAMWEIRTRALRTQSAGHYAADVLAQWTSWPAPDSYPRLLAAGGGVLALHDGRLVGYAILDKAGAEIDAVFVDPDFAGHGIGKRLLRGLEAMLPGAPLHLYASLNAVPFYQAAGFRPQERTQYQHPSGLLLDCVHMVKP
jgi:GNAT superfamily N-acetyltransferase